MSGIAIDVGLEGQHGSNKELQQINSNLLKIAASAEKSSQAMINLANGFKLDGLRNNTRGANNEISQLAKLAVPSLLSIQRATEGLGRSMGAAKTMVVGLVAAFSAIQGLKSIYSLMDEFTGLQNRLRLVTEGTQELISAQRDLLKTSRETRSGLSNTIKVYTDIAAAMKGVGGSGAEFQALTKTIQQTITISGSSAEAASASLVQLSQGLSSGVLRGEELNSVFEGNRRLAMALTDSLKMTSGQLRKFAANGGLTTEIVLNAIADSAKTIDSEFKKTNATASQGFRALADSIMYFEGTLNGFTHSSTRAYNVTSGIAAAITDAADSMGPQLYLASQGLRNYIGNLDMYSAAMLTVKGMSKLDISLGDVHSAYTEYKVAKQHLDSLREAIDKLRGVKKEGLLDGLMPKKPTLPFDEQLKQAARFANSLVYVFTGIFDKFHWLIPDIRPPLQEVVSTTTLAAKRVGIAAEALAIEYLRPFYRASEGMAEALQLFTKGDHQLERSWVNLFKSADFSEVIVNMYGLGEAMRSIRFSNWGNIGRDILYLSVGMLENTRAVLRFFNVIDNRTLFLNNIRFDRAAQAFQTLGSIVKRVYEDVIYPAVAPTAYKYYTYAKGAYDALADALTDYFSSTRGVAQARRIKSFFNGLFTGIRQFFTTPIDLSGLFDGVSDTVKSEAKALFASLTRVFKAFSEYASSLASELIAGSHFDIHGFFGSIVENAKRLSTDALGYIKQFTSEVARLFFVCYDKVVGHSYWPDLIDGVIGESKLLSVAMANVKTFAANVSKSFNDLTISVSTGELTTKLTGWLQNTLSSVNVEAATDKLTGRIIGIGLTMATLMFSKNVWMKAISLDYLSSLIELKLNNVSHKLFEVIASTFGKGAGDILGVFVDSAAMTLDVLVGALPAFTKSFTNALGGVGTTVSQLLDTLPMNGLSYVIFWGTAAASTGVLGKGAKAQAISMITGLFTSLSGLVGSLSGGSPLIGRLLLGANPKFLYGAIAAFSTSVLQSISLLEASLIGVPLLVRYVMGSDLGGRLIRDIISTVIPDIGKLLLSKVGIDLAKVRAKIAAAMAGTFALPATSSVMGNIVSSIFKDFGKAWTNASRNVTDYIAGNINIYQLFTRNQSGSTLDLTNNIKKLFNAIDFEVKVGWARLKRSMLGQSVGKLGTAVTDLMQGIKTGLAHANITLPDFGSVFANAWSSAKTKMTDFYTRLSNFAGSLVGPNGLIQKFIGTVASNKAAVVAAIAVIGLLGSSMANAASAPSMSENIGSSIKAVLAYAAAIYVLAAAWRVYSAAKLGLGFDQLKKEFTKIKDMVTAIAGFVGPMLAKAFAGIRAAAGAMIANIFTLEFAAKAFVFIGRLFIAPIQFIGNFITSAKALGASLTNLGPVFKLFGRVLSSAFDVAWKAAELAITGIVKALMNLRGGLGLVGTAIRGLFSLKGLAIAAGVAGTSGVLYATFFGPKGDFLDKLEWAVAAAARLTGLTSATNRSPRYKEQAKLLDAPYVSDAVPNYSEQLAKIDFEEMNSKQYDLLSKTSKVSGDALRRFATATEKNGKLAEDQVAELANVIKQQDAAIAVTPKLKHNALFKDSRRQLESALDFNDTSLFSKTKVFIAFLDNQFVELRMVSNEISKATADIFTSLGTVPTDIASTLRSWGHDIRSWFPDSKVEPEVKVEPKVSFLASRLGNYSIGINAISDEIAKGLDSTKSNIQSFMDDYKRFEEQVSLARTQGSTDGVKSLMSGIQDYQVYFDKSEMNQVISLMDTYAEAQRAINPITFRTAEEHKALSDNLELARGNFMRTGEAMLEYGKQQEALAAQRGSMDKWWLWAQAGVSESGFGKMLGGGKDSGGYKLDFLWSAEDSQRLTADEDKINEFKETIRKLGDLHPKAIEVKVQINSIRKTQDSLNSLYKAITLLDPAIDLSISLSNVEVTKAQILELFKVNPEAFDEWMKLTKQLGESQALYEGAVTKGNKAEIAAILNTSEEIRAKMQAIAPKDMFKSFNAELSSIGADSIDASGFIKLGETIRSDVTQKLIEAKKISKELTNPNLKDSEYLSLFEQLLTKAQAINNLMKASVGNFDSISSNFGVTVGKAASLPSETQSKLVNLGNQKDANEKFLKAGKPSHMSDAQWSTTSQAVGAAQVQIEKDISTWSEKLSDKSASGGTKMAKSLSEAFSEYLKRSGLTASLDDYIQLDDVGKALFNEIAAKSAMVNKKLAKTRIGDIPTESQAADLKKISGYQKEQDALISNSKLVNRSIDDMVASYASLYDGFTLASLFELPPETLRGLKELDDKIQALKIETAKPARDQDLAGIAAKMKEIDAQKKSYARVTVSSADSSLSAKLPDSSSVDNATRVKLSNFALEMDKLKQELDNTTQGIDTTVLREKIKGMDVDFEKLVISSTSGIEQSMAMAKFANVSMDKVALSLLDATQKELVNSMLTQLGPAESAANANPNDQKLAAEVAGRKQKIADVVERGSFASRANAAGTSFGESVTSSFTSGITEVLKGKKSSKDFITELADTFTSGILDAFMKGLMDPFTGKNGMINQMLQEMGSMAFGLPQGPAKSAGDSGGGAAKQLFGGLAGLFTGKKKDARTGVAAAKIDSETKINGWSAETTTALENSTQQTVTAIDTASVKNSIDFSKMAVGFETGLTEMGGLINSSFLDIQRMNNFGIDIPAGASVDWLRSAVGAVGKFMGAGGSTDATVATDSPSYGGYADSAGVGSTSMYSGGSASTSGSTALNYDISGANVSFRDSTVDFMRRAAGGYISGEGGPTADKIPALLSNGEFVINAKQTKRFAPLIEAINSGSIAHFATGGYVGADIGNTVVVKAAEKRNVEMGFVAGAQKSTSVFNINVTGDISRQTKSEIQRMIPQIAAGVGKHNYERR